MVITKRQKLHIRNILLIILLLLLIPFCDRTRIGCSAGSSESFNSDKIKATIAMPNDMYSSKGLKAGINYEMLKAFAQEHDFQLDAIAAKKGENWVDSLRLGATDIVIMNYDEQQNYDGLRLSIIVDNVVWAVNASKIGEQKEINQWLNSYTNDKEYINLRHRFFRAYEPMKRVARNDVSRQLTPYDALIKKYAAQLGWDWRLLAALIYQESKFSINGFSRVGCGGLMQVRPSTAKVYGIDNLLDPESNIIAGTSFLKRLSNLYKNENMDSLEKIKFTLAAYNAGEGRIADCRNYAASKQVDSCKWDEIVKIIPDMRDDKILQEDTVKLGKFKGYETINYVDRIMQIYQAMCTICPEA